MKIWVFWAEINRISLLMLLLHQSYEFLHTIAPTFNNESNQIKIELYTVLECRLIMKFKVRTVTRNRIPMKMPTANIGERTSSNWNKREGNRQLIARSTVTQRKNIRKPTNRVKMSSVHVAHRYTCTWMTHNSISKMNWCELRMWCREWGARRAMKKWALTCVSSASCCLCRSCHVDSTARQDGRTRRSQVSAAVGCCRRSRAQLTNSSRRTGHAPIRVNSSSS